MTIQDLIDSGIQLQGNVLVKKYDEEQYEYIELVKTNNIQKWYNAKLSERGIKHMYSENNELVIEIEE